MELVKLAPEMDLISSENFNDTGNEAVIKLRDRNNFKKINIYSISILLSLSGEQRVYIITPEFCEKKSNKTTTYFLKTEGKNVVYTSFCYNKKKAYTPKENQGNRYLIDLLNEENAIAISFSERVIKFDTQGFSNAWINYGGNAL